MICLQKKKMCNLRPSHRALSQLSCISYYPRLYLLFFTVFHPHPAQQCIQIMTSMFHIQTPQKNPHSRIVSFQHHHRPTRTHTNTSLRSIQYGINSITLYHGLRSSTSLTDITCQASTNKVPDNKLPDNDTDTNIIGSAGIFLLWAALAGYAFFISPNQTPLRDQYFIEKFVGITSDSVPINQVFTQLFYIMGVWPLIYTALLIPAGKSKNGVPAWPFVFLSYGFGAFALLPFMALWQQPSPTPSLPPTQEDLQGTGNLLTKGMESPVIAWLLLAGALYCIFNAATAGGDSWAEYLRLLQESRLVHVTTVDFLTLTSLAAFWMDNDATCRKWSGKENLLPILSVIPVIGPAVYLVLRPKASS